MRKAASADIDSAANTKREYVHIALSSGMPFFLTNERRLIHGRCFLFEPFFPI